MDTKPVKFNKDTDISLKMKRGSEIVEDVIFPNAQMKKDFIKAIRARVLQPEKNVTEFRNKDLAELFPISEKQAGRAAKYFIKKLGLKYAIVPIRTASEVIKKTKDILEQTSSNLQEDRIRVAKTPVLDELGLKKKMDTAHRVSKTHMAKLGLEFNTDIMGIDSRLINQIIVKPSEIQLDKLYRKQFEIFEKLKKNRNSVELKDNLRNINKQVTDIVKNTSGRLVGVVIDPDTLDTSFQGIKKKYSFSNVLGESMTMKELANIPKEEQVKFLTKQLPKAIQLEVNRGFVPNDFKNILSNPDSQKAILNYAKQKAPELIAPLKKAFLDPTSKVSLRLFSQFPAIATTGLVGLGVYKGMGFDEEVRADDMSTPVDPGVSVQQQEQFDPEKADPTLKTAAGAYGAYKYGPQLLKILGNVGKGGVRLVASPFVAGTAAVSELMSEDPSQALAGSQLLYPEIIRQASDKGIKAVSGVKRFADKFKLGYDKLLALTPNLKYAPMVSKGMSLLGTAMIGADVVQGLEKRIGPSQRGPLTEQELLDMRGKETYMGNIADTFDKAYQTRSNFRGGDAARSDAASGRDAGRASPSGGVDDRGSDAQNLNQQGIVAAANIRNAQPQKSPFQTFLDHSLFTKGLKRVGSIPNYHQLGGFDFMSRFPNTPPSVAKGLGYAYQGLTEFGKSLTDPDYSLEEAYDRAKEEGRLNAVGIDDFFDPNSLTAQQYFNLPSDLQPNFAVGGRVGFYVGGGADMGGVADSQGNVGPSGGGNNDGPDDRSTAAQTAAHNAAVAAAQAANKAAEQKMNIIDTLSRFRPNTFVNPYNYSIGLNKNIGPFGLNVGINTLGMLGIDDPRTPEDESEQDDYAINAGYNTDLFGGNLSLGAGYNPTTGTNLGLSFSKQFNQGGRVGFADGPEDPKKRATMKKMGIAGGIAGGLMTGLINVMDLFKGAKKGIAATKAAESEAQKVFFDLVNAVKNKGVMNKLDDLLETKVGVKYEYKGVEVLEDGENIELRFNTDKGAPAVVEYRKPGYDVDPEAGTSYKVPGEFVAEGQEVGRYGKDGDVDIDFEDEIIDTFEDTKKIIDD